MKASGLLAVCFVLAFLLGDRTKAEAQRFNRSGSDTLEGSGLEIGMQLPDLTVYNAGGRPFSLAELKGSYAVLVFGCLT